MNQSGFEELRRQLERLQQLPHDYESESSHVDADQVLIDCLRAMPSLIVGQPGMQDVAKHLVRAIIREYRSIPKWFA